MKNSFILCLAIPLSVACLASCQDDNDPSEDTLIDDQIILDQTLNLPGTHYNYANLDLPAHYGAPPLLDANNTPANNPVTDAGATLGRVLFYDTQLSANNTVACASCHLQQNGFSDPSQFSEGFDGGFTGRNSMGLANAAYYINGRFFWDERAATLEQQVLLPIQDPVEMGMTLPELEDKLQATDYYPVLFRQAFGDEAITSDRVSLALAQFVRSIVSYNSKYDEGLAMVPPPQGGNPINNLPNFTAQENLGLQVFNTNGCGACHGTTANISDQARNNGLDMVYADNGLGDVTGNPADNGKFKSPSLRNIALTAPFMHDGRFQTLMEVVEHYDNGVQPHPNLDNRLKVPNTNQPRQLNLSQEEKNALVAFLNTLTDNDLSTDEKYSDPFK